VTAAVLPAPGQVADQLLAAVGKGMVCLRPLNRSTVQHRPAPDRWTIQEVIGHLVDSAANNHQRFVRAQFARELRLPKYEQNDWVRCQAYSEIDWFELLDFWQAYNRHLAHVIRHVPATALTVPCLIGNYAPATLHFLMHDYVVHLQHHLQKINERLAGQSSAD
jgi:hypothetical protein